MDGSDTDDMDAAADEVELASDATLSVEVQPRYEMTVGRMIALIRAGHEIVYTPHIGNRWREDMALARMGVPQVTFNRNQVLKDPIDQPDRMRVEGRNLELAGRDQERVVAAYMDMTGRDADEARRIMGNRFGAAPGSIHYASAAAATPGEYSVSDDFLYLRDDYSARMVDVLEHISGDREIDPFSRRIVDRRIVKSSATGEPHVMNRFMDLMVSLRDNVNGTSDIRREGPIPSNDFAVATLALRAGLKRLDDGDDGEGGMMDTYAVSGPSMIKYTKTRRSRRILSQIYDRAREVDPRLPQQIRLNMIPGALLEFMPHEGETRIVELVRDIARLEQEKIRIGNELAALSPGPEKSAAIGRKTQLEKQQRPLQAEYRTLRFTDRTQENGIPFYSQYDVLRTGHQIAQIDELNDITFAQVRNLFQDDPKKKQKTPA